MGTLLVGPGDKGRPCPERRLSKHKKALVRPVLKNKRERGTVEPNGDIPFRTGNEMEKTRSKREKKGAGPS